MSYQEANLKGVYLFTPKIFEDSRGHFFESFRVDSALREIGQDFQVAQVNNSLSSKGVLRGIHFQQQPSAQGKFVSVQTGSIYDVAVDLRKGSPTFGEWQGFFLSEANKQSLFLSRGIGHAFLSLEEKTQVTYLCDAPFNPINERSIHPLSLAIDWRDIASQNDIGDFSMSEKDRIAPEFDKYSGPLLGF